MAETGAERADVEIERRFLLRAMPPLPPGAEAWRIDQGYLPDASRLRRAVGPRGEVVCTRTVKTGRGLVRRERQRRIERRALERLWPQTAQRRLAKTRHRVEAGGLTWEIDEYHDLDLVLAEVELPSARAAAAPPPWLAPLIVREVTGEPAYENYELALRAARRR